MKLLTEKQAAKMMQCSPATLYRLRRDKTIRHYRKLGRLIRYTEQDIALNVEDMKAFKPSPVAHRPVSEARFG